MSEHDEQRSDSAGRHAAADDAAEATQVWKPAAGIGPRRRRRREEQESAAEETAVFAPVSADPDAAAKPDEQTLVKPPKAIQNTVVDPPTPPDENAVVDAPKPPDEPDKPESEPETKAPQDKPKTAPEATSVLQLEPSKTTFVAMPTQVQQARPEAEQIDPGTESLAPIQTDAEEGKGSGHTGSSTGTSTGTRGTGSSPMTSRRTSSRTGSRRSSTRGGLGAGLVDVPRVAYRNPHDAVMANPVVAEKKRFCSNCNAKVGRGVDGKPGPAEGTCAKCGTEFSFKARLSPGDLVGGQYEVLGALAYGGLGWIYLAQDHNVADRWVVLKGLIDTGDETAAEAAIMETKFLAEVEHPNIVKIYNLVEHPDPKTGTTVGYIVMEYVGGKSLRELAIEHHKTAGAGASLPIGQVIAYGLEILPAMGYLHDQGLLYCDLKPDNVIQTNEQLKLIDLGAVRHMDDWDSPLFFTAGYSSPELPTHGASVASDLYTVGRTLAVLSFEFTGYTSKYKASLPTPAEVPLFAQYDSYYRFLQRACHPDPARRFANAAEMADQLKGVLREIIATTAGEPQPGRSTMFSTETHSFGVDTLNRDDGDDFDDNGVPEPEVMEIVRGLPTPMVDTDDPAAQLLASVAATEPRAVIEALAGAPHHSIEVRLRVVRARIELDELAEANRQLQAAQYIAVKSGFPHDWRLEWYRGLIELAGKRPKLAVMAFDAVCAELPGELAPKLALAAALELTGDYPRATKLYEVVWRTDRSFVSAGFGLARAYLSQGAKSNAVTVLESIPSTSTHYTAAQVSAVKVSTSASPSANPLQQPANGQVAEADVVNAARRLERLKLDPESRARMKAQVLEAAFDLVHTRGIKPADAGARVLGRSFEERDLRLGLERSYRDIARFESDSGQRVSLIDKANKIRPRTLT